MAGPCLKVELHISVFSCGIVAGDTSLVLSERALGLPGSIFARVSLDWPGKPAIFLSHFFPLWFQCFFSVPHVQTAWRCKPSEALQKCPFSHGSHFSIPTLILGNQGYPSESGTGWRKEMRFRHGREMPKGAYLALLERERGQQRWEGKINSWCQFSRHFFWSYWEGENKWHYNVVE